MAIWYIDPTASDSDSFDGGYGTGKLRSTWTDVVVAAGNKYYGKAGTESNLGSGGGLLLSGSDAMLGAYGGLGKHTVNARSVLTGNYGVRLQGTRNILENIILLSPISTPNGIQIGSSGSAVVIRNVDVIGSGLAAAVGSNTGIAVQTLNAVYVTASTVSLHNTGIAVAPPGDLVAPHVYSGLRLYDLYGNSASDGDGMTVGGIAGPDMSLCTIRRCDVSGFAENGIDLTGSSNIRVEDCYIHAPRASVVTPVGMLFGNTGILCQNNKIVRVVSVGSDTAFHTRGGVAAIMESCIGIGLTKGLTVSGGSPNNTIVKNCTLIGAEAAVRIGIGTNSSGHVISNSVLISGNYGVNVDAGCSATVRNCVSNKTVANGAGTITDGGGNQNNLSLALSADNRPTLASSWRDQGADLGYLRDITGKQCRKHIGAYGAARLVPVDGS